MQKHNDDRKFFSLSSFLSCSSSSSDVSSSCHVPCLLISLPRLSGPEPPTKTSQEQVHQGSPLPARPVRRVRRMTAVSVQPLVCEHLRVRACPSVSERVRGVSAEWPSVSRPDGRRDLAVWPLDSRRVAWPHLCTLGWGSEETRVEWSAIYPVSAPIPVPDPQ